MRSPAELWFRIRQEAGNLRLLLLPPAAVPVPRPLPLPAPDRVKPLLDPTYTAHLQSLAQRIAAGALPAFDTWIDPGPAVAWRRDYRHGTETSPRYFRRVPYLDFTQAGDHKWIWEINRHQHLVTLAQAWALSPDPALLDALGRQLESWLEQNPPQRGINWASALEVAFRALSWMWIWHLAGPALPAPLAARFLRMLYLHGLHLEANLSVYFSPNTHLLGEALALDALGRFFPDMPPAAGWVETGSAHMAAALHRQVRADGSHFEQSSYYHVYTLDMLLFHRVLAGTPAPAEEAAILARMAAYLTALLGTEGRIPLIGDDDGGRLFHPFGPRDGFGRATLAVYHALTGTPAPPFAATAAAHSEMAAWWLAAPVPPSAPPATPESVLFADAGLGFLRGAGPAEVIADCGPFGSGSAGHSHADTLQILVRRAGRDLLIDPGTCTYISDPALREQFRRAAAHTTVSVTGTGQAVASGPFRWLSPPAVRVLGWQDSPQATWLAAECRFGPFRHRRALLWEKEIPRLWLADVIEWDDTAAHEFTQNWPLGEEPESVVETTIFCAGARLALEAGGKMSMQKIWRSSHYGHREPAVAAAVVWTSQSPARRAAMIDWNTGAGAATLQAEWEPGHVMLTAVGAGAAVRLNTEEQRTR